MAAPPLRSRTLIEDPTSPYYLHPSEGPGLLLVSQLLTGDNYSSWSRAVLLSLSVKNKLGFLDGSIPKPTADPELLQSWLRNSNMVFSWLLNSLAKEIQASVLYSTSAHELWIDLKTRFQQGNNLRMFQLRKDLALLTQSNDYVTVYFTKLKALWDELSNFRPSCTCHHCTCGGVQCLSDYINTEHVLCFLMGVNDAFQHSRSQILLMDPLPSINKVFSLLIQEERQRQLTFSSPLQSQNMTLLARADSPRSSAPPQFKRKGRPFCTHCNTHGHTVEHCYKLHGYPPGFGTRKTPLHHSKGYSINQASALQPSMDSLFNSLNPAQCQQFVSLFSNHCSVGAAEAPKLPSPAALISSTSSTAGSFAAADWQG